MIAAQARESLPQACAGPQCIFKGSKLTLLDRLRHVETQVRVVRQLAGYLPQSNRRRMRQACLWITQQDGIHALSSQEGIDIMALRRDVHQHRPDRAERNRD
jgi:hypothetical protein